MQDRPLSGQVALVTGAGTGIGHATALALAELGATVALHYFQNASGAQAGVEQIRADGGCAEMFAADLTDPTAATGLVDRVVAEFGRLDMLVNNAGNPLQRTPLEQCPLEVWRAAFDINVTSAFLVTQRAIPHLRKTRGRIVNNLSLSVQTGGAGGAGPYAAAKGALQVFTRTLSRELAPDVRVNAVMPGVIETRHHEVFSTPERMADYRRQTPLGRNGQAHEAAAAIAFLCGPGSSFMTGSLLDISGGRFLR
jgi:3-oxoacyl-[acyl-carrier protein] reductase